MAADGSVIIISTLAPLAGSDELAKLFDGVIERFQPSLPSRGATAQYAHLAIDYFDFNPRSPRGERRRDCRNRPISQLISTLAPLAGSDPFLRL